MSGIRVVLVLLLATNSSATMVHARFTHAHACFADTPVGFRRSHPADRLAAHIAQVRPLSPFESCEKALRYSASSTRKSLSLLSMHLSPLASAECAAVPNVPVAAVGFAGAIAAVLSSADQSDNQIQAAIGGEDAHDLDVQLAIDLAHMSEWTYHSCDVAGEEEATNLLTRDLQTLGYQLVSEVRGQGGEVYAYVARNTEHSALSVVFRGSCTLKNVITDIDYKDSDHKAAEALGQETSMRLPKGMNLHRGFVESYLALRRDLIDVITSSQLEQGAPPLKVQITGHSLGGAMAMLCALDVDNLRKDGRVPCGRIQTTTFAAPRVGDAAFASLFERVFPHPSDFVALQAPSDAVPHLPFAAWGFRHPTGTLEILPEAVLCDNQPTASAAESAACHLRCSSVVRRSEDPGDSIDALRPKDGRPVNWATSHDIQEYLGHLHQLLAGQRHQMLVAPSA